MQAGDVLASRYRLEDLLAEAGTGRFWRAHDLVLHRPVAVHILAADDPRADAVLEAARRTGPVIDRRVLRVLDAESSDGRCFVVHEWGQGESLDVLLTREGPLPPRRAAWLVAEVADSLTDAHEGGLAHGSLTPENVLVDQHGQVRIIGFGVEAALRGLPAGRVAVDEVDLAGLLYCALTGKWAGVSGSSLPPAPEVHGEVLRPRRVRAGIPRLLDTLCDEVLNGHQEAGQHRSARQVRDLLHDYVGELTGTHTAVPVTRAAPLPPPASSTPTRPADPAPTESLAARPTPEPEPDPAPPAPPVEAPTQVTEPAAAGGSESATPATSTDLPTQAGMPVFHDDDEVDWLRARADKPAPPPPLTDPTPKPLFAPDPPEGQPVRRPRPGSRAAQSGSDYWPWDSSQDTGRPTGGGRDTGGWSSGAWGDDTDGTGEDSRVPGRRWIRLAMVVAVVVSVVVAAVAAYQLGLRPPADDSADDTTSETSTPATPAAPTAYTGITGQDFDPQGTDGGEYPELVPNVLDGDPATAWRTSTYLQNFGPGGLKSGVGLILDLGTAKGVRQVRVTTSGGATSLAAYVTTEPPTAIAGLTPVGTASGDGELTIDLDEAVSGRYVTVWLTVLPAVEGGFRGEITDVQVLG